MPFETGKARRHLRTMLATQNLQEVARWASVVQFYVSHTSSSLAAVLTDHTLNASVLESTPEFATP